MSFVRKEKFNPVNNYKYFHELTFLTASFIISRSGDCNSTRNSPTSPIFIQN